jgi:hypothetical protein
MRDACGEESRTFAVDTIFLFLGICGFAASMIEGQEVERKVLKFQLYLKFWGEQFGSKASGEPVMNAERRICSLSIKSIPIT